MCPSFAVCLHNFQTLIAGGFAVIIGAITAYAIAWSARHVPERERERQRELEDRRVKVECLALSSDLMAVARRATMAQGTMVAVIAAQKDVTDSTREKTKLRVPELISDWEFMSLLPADIAQSLLRLGRSIEAHNFDMDRAGGSFGADNFQSHVKRQVQAIRGAATEVRARIDALAMSGLDGGMKA